MTHSKLFFTLPPVERNTFVAYTVKGLTWLTCNEINTVIAGNATFTTQKDRYVTFTINHTLNLTNLFTTRTADDIRIVILPETLIRTPEELKNACGQAAETIRETLDEDRREDQRWSLTLTAKNPPWKTGGWNPSGIFSSTLNGANPADTQRQPVDVKVYADGNLIHMSLNLTQTPIGKRSTANRPGALRPTVAAAMIQLLDPQPNEIMYDAFCGSGTTLIEAKHFGVAPSQIYGSDIDPDAVNLTRQRIKTNPSAARNQFFVRNVLLTQPDRVFRNTRQPVNMVSNLPWGKQITVKRHSELHTAVAKIAAETLHTGGSAVLLTPHSTQLSAAVKRTAGRDTHIETHQIGLLGQTPTLVVLRPER